MMRPLSILAYAAGVLAAGVIAEAQGDVARHEGGEDTPPASLHNEDAGARPTMDYEKLGWLDDDTIEVYYGEFLLAQWILEHAPWNAYHSGVAFRNNRTGEKCLFDYSPLDTSSVMNMVIPEVQMEFELLPYLTGDVNLVWRDGAKTQYFPYWPPSYTNTILLATHNGSIFYRYAKWVREYYSPQFHAFQPIEIAVPGEGTVQRSRMCHDFVTDSLWVLYEEGVVFPNPDSPIFRDHIIMYATEMDKVTEFTATARGKRQWLRYLRGLWIYLDLIKEQFTHARHALAVAWKLGLPVFLHNEGNDFKVQLVAPFLNYCYLPLAMPPKVHDPFAKMKLCALGMDAVISNVTQPFPWGTVLAVEERLDRNEALIAIILVALFAVLCAGGSGAGQAEGQQPEKAN